MYIYIFMDIHITSLLFLYHYSLCSIDGMREKKRKYWPLETRNAKGTATPAAPSMSNIADMAIQCLEKSHSALLILLLLVDVVVKWGVGGWGEHFCFVHLVGWLFVKAKVQNLRATEMKPKATGNVERNTK